MSGGIQLALRMGKTKAEPVPPAVVEALSEVQVSAAASSQSGFQLKFTLGKRSAVAERLRTEGYFDPWRRVIVTVVVRGTPHVLMDGVITQQDVAPSDQAGASTLTVTGLDLTALMDFLDLSGTISYPAMPSHAIVGRILLSYAALGVAPVIVPGMIPQIPDPRERFITHRGTDLAFVQALARKTGYVFYLEPGPRPGISSAYWGPEARYGDLQPALSINLDASSNVESLSFSYDGLKREKMVAVIQEPRTRIPIPIPIPDITLLKRRLAEQPAAVMKTRILPVARFDAAAASELALAALAGPADAVTASGELDVLRYGHVLKPRSLVQVRGAGQQFNGRYYVTSVTHNLRRGRYTQSFSLARGGIKSDIARVEP